MDITLGNTNGFYLIIESIRTRIVFDLNENAETRFWVAEKSSNRMYLYLDFMDSTRDRPPKQSAETPAEGSLDRGRSSVAACWRKRDLGQIGVGYRK